VNDRARCFGRLTRSHSHLRLWPLALAPPPFGASYLFISSERDFERRSSRWVRPNFQAAIGALERALDARKWLTEAFQTAHELAARLPAPIATRLRPCRAKPRTRSGRAARYSGGGRSGAGAQPATCLAPAPAVSRAWRRSLSRGQPWRESSPVAMRAACGLLPAELKTPPGRRWEPQRLHGPTFEPASTARCGRTAGDASTFPVGLSLFHPGRDALGLGMAARRLIAALIALGALLALQPTAAATDGGHDRYCRELRPICHIGRLASCRCESSSTFDCKWRCEAGQSHGH